MTINIDAKTWQRNPSQVAGGRFYSDVDKVPAGLVNGQTIILNGSGFGAVAQPLPVGEETFDQYADGLSGTLLHNLPSHRINGSDSPYATDYMLTDAVKLPGRKYGAVQAAAGSAHTGTMVPVNGSFATHSNYATFWFRANEVLTPPTQPATGSNKFIRIWDDFVSGSGTRVSLTTQQNSPGGNGQFYAYMNSFDPDQITVNEWWDDTALHQTPNVWRRFEVYVDGNTGAAWFNLDGKRIKTSTAFQKDPAYLGTVLQPALFGYDVGNSSVTSTLRTYLADLFSTQTAARVELSNNATFDQTTYQKRYYQRTLTRADGQIQFELFLGDLDVNNLYAHVLDSQGALIQTIPVTGLSNSVTVAHGDTVTITGTGFGTRTNVKPVYVSYGATKTPSNLGRTAAVKFDTNAVADVSRSLGQTGGSVRFDVNNGPSSAPTAFDNLTIDGTKPSITYIERYYDFDITDPAVRDPSGGSNLKTNRWWATGKTYPNVYVGYQGNDGANSVRMFVEGVSNNTSNYYGVGVPPQQWLSEEFLLKRSSAQGVKDGELRHIRNNVWVNSANKYLITTHDATYPNPFSLLVLDQMSNNDLFVALNIYYNYVLVDDEFNGVYVGNASTLAACTQLVRQPQTSWSNTSITFQAVETVVTLDGAWAYVRTGIDSWQSTNGIPSSLWSVA